RRRPDLPLPRLWWLFATFIFACGMVHLLEASLFWWPVYRLAGVVKFLTAIAAWARVLALLPLVPVAMTFRSPAELEDEVLQRTSELRKATRKMLDNDERLRLALLAGRMGTWSWDLSTNQLEFDDAETELTGLGKGGKPFPVEQFF